MARKDLTIEETLDYVMGTKDFIKQLIQGQCLPGRQLDAAADLAWHVFRPLLQGLPFLSLEFRPCVSWSSPGLCGSGQLPVGRVTLIFSPDQRLFRCFLLAVRYLLY